MGDPDWDEWHFVGKHRFRPVPPDLFRIVVSGDASAGEVASFYAAMEQHMADTPFAVLADVSRLGAFPSSARKAAADGKKLPIDAIVLVGTSRPLRLIIQLISRAYEMLSGDPSPAKIFFADTDAEALRWIEERRRSRKRLTLRPGGAAPRPDRSR